MDHRGLQIFVKMKIKTHFNTKRAIASLAWPAFPLHKQKDCHRTLKEFLPCSLFFFVCPLTITPGPSWGSFAEWSSQPFMEQYPSSFSSNVGFFLSSLRSGLSISRHPLHRVPSGRNFALYGYCRAKQSNMIFVVMESRCHLFEPHCLRSAFISF